MIAALIFALASSPQAVTVSLSCAPKDVTARILKSPNPNDTHPDWAGEDTIGTSWSLAAHARYYDDAGRTYLTGEIISPRGAIVTAQAFVLESEWTCSENR